MRVLPAIALLILLAGCSKQRAAQYYFNEVIAHSNSVTGRASNFEGLATNAVSKSIGLMSEFKELESKRVSLVKRIEKELASLRNMETFEDDYQLRDGTIAYLEHLRQVYENEWKTVVEYRQAIFISEQNYANIRYLGGEIARKEQMEALKFREAQQAFGTKFEFPIKF